MWSTAVCAIIASSMLKGLHPISLTPVKPCILLTDGWLGEVPCVLECWPGTLAGCGWTPSEQQQDEWGNQRDMLDQCQDCSPYGEGGGGGWSWSKAEAAPACYQHILGGKLFTHQATRFIQVTTVVAAAVLCDITSITKALHLMNAVRTDRLQQRGDGSHWLWG